MILINIKMQIRPEKMDEWLTLADSYAKDVNAEEGCLFFRLPEPERRQRVHLHRGLQGRRGRRCARQERPREEVLRGRARSGRHPAADHLHRHPA